MEQPPCNDGCGHNQQPEYLVAPIVATLIVTPRLFGSLLEIRLDAGVNHVFATVSGPALMAQRPV